MAWSTQKKLSLLLLRSRDDHNNPFFALKLFSFDYLKKKEKWGIDIFSTHHIWFKLFLERQTFQKCFSFCKLCVRSSSVVCAGAVRLYVRSLEHAIVRLWISLSFLAFSFSFGFVCRLVRVVGWPSSKQQSSKSRSDRSPNQRQHHRQKITGAHGWPDNSGPLTNSILLSSKKTIRRPCVPNPAPDLPVHWRYIYIPYVKICR